MVSETCKKSECTTCSKVTSVIQMEAASWCEKTNDFSLVWMCIYCVNFIKKCSFCGGTTLGTICNWVSSIRHTLETIQILRETGKVICEDCCELIAASGAAAFAASVDTRPGYFQKSLGRPPKLSEEEYEVSWGELAHGYRYEWVDLCAVYWGTLRDVLEDACDPDDSLDPQEIRALDKEEFFHNKNERKQNKKSGKCSGKSNKPGKDKKSYKLTTANPGELARIRGYADSQKIDPEVIPHTPRDALRRMDIPYESISDIDMEMEFRVVWTLERPTKMNVSVPVPACLLKCREPLSPIEYAKILVVVWKAYRKCEGRFLDWSDEHIRTFLESKLIIDFTVKPLDV